MDTRTRTQRRYDHRFRDLVQTTRNIDCALQRGVPRSTARSWLTKPHTQVVTVDVLDMNTIRQQEEILRLRAQVHKLTALLRVLLVVLRISRASQNLTRLSDPSHKRALLHAIHRSRSVFPLRAVLRVIRLSPSCYHAWNRPEPCAGAGPSSCPRSFPQQLTATEFQVIHEMVTSEAYRHVPTGTLSRLAQRLGNVFASSSTWYRLVRHHQWPVLVNGSTPKRRRSAFAPPDPMRSGM